MKSYRQWLFRIGQWGSIILLLAAIFLGGQYWLWLGKVHEVSKSSLYRSAQLSSGSLAHVIKDKKILAILNLRGEAVNQAWYQEERDLARQKNITYYNLAMNSYALPSKTQLLQLTHILQKSPKPLLIHCEGGADRTGLAAAIYLILQNKSIKEAEKEYSLHYYVIHKASVGKLVIPVYAAWLKKNHLNSSGSNFLRWLGAIENVGHRHPERSRGISFDRLGACGRRSLDYARDDRSVHNRRFQSHPHWLAQS